MAFNLKKCRSIIYKLKYVTTDVMEKCETIVIQEVYECENAEEMFEIQLEKALEVMETTALIF